MHHRLLCVFFFEIFVFLTAIAYSNAPSLFVCLHLPQVQRQQLCSCLVFPLLLSLLRDLVVRVLPALKPHISIHWRSDCQIFGRTLFAYA